MFAIGTYPLARHLATLTSTKTFDPVVTPTGARFTGDLFVTWGLGYVADVTGIRVFIEDVIDPGGDYHNLVFSYPFDWDLIGQFTWSGSGWLGAIAVRLLFTNYNLTVDGACNWLFEFDQLDFEIYIGGIWVTVYTIGPQSMGGTGFDKREDAAEMIPYAEYSPAFTALSPPTCALYDDKPSYLNNARAILVGGWERYDGSTWIRDNVRSFSTGLGNTPGCSCFSDPPGFTAVDSASITTEMFVQDEFIRSPKTTQDFCPSGCTGDAIHDVWTLRQKITSRFNEVKAVADTWGIRDLNVHTFELGCLGSETPVESDTPHLDLPTTYCEETRSITYTDGSTTCNVGTNHCTCMPPDGPVFPPANPQFCYWGGTIVITWPTAPPCSLALGCLSADTTDSGRHSLGWVQDGTFWLQSSDNKGVSWPEKDSGLAAECCCIDYDKQLQPTPLFAWLEDGGVIKRYRTDDEGDSYGMPTTVSTGTGNSFPAARVRRAGLMYQYWIHETAGVYDVKGRIDDRAGNVVVAEFTAITGVEKAGLTAELWPDAGGVLKIALWVIQGGSKVRHLSDNGQAFA